MTDRTADHLGMAHYVLHTLCDMLAARVSLEPEDSHARAVHALAWHAMDLTADAMVEQDERKSDPSPSLPAYTSPDLAPQVPLSVLPPRFNLTSAQAAERLGLERTKAAGILTLARLGLIEARIVLTSSSGNSGYSTRYDGTSVERLADLIGGDR